MDSFRPDLGDEQRIAAHVDYPKHYRAYLDLACRHHDSHTGTASNIVWLYWWDKLL